MTRFYTQNYNFFISICFTENCIMVKALKTFIYGLWTLQRPWPTCIDLWVMLAGLVVCRSPPTLERPLWAPRLSRRLEVSL